jgi:hypothetical protein
MQRNLRIWYYDCKEREKGQVKSGVRVSCLCEKQNNATNSLR